MGIKLFIKRAFIIEKDDTTQCTPILQLICHPFKTKGKYEFLLPPHPPLLTMPLYIFFVMASLEKNQFWGSLEKKPPRVLFYTMDKLYIMVWGQLPLPVFWGLNTPFIICLAFGDWTRWTFLSILKILLC